MEKNLLNSLVLTKDNEISIFEENTSTSDSDGKPEEKPEAPENPDGEDKTELPTDPPEVSTEEEIEDTLPTQDIIRVLHEHNEWELNEEAVGKYENSEDGLMQFLGDIVTANTPEPEFASDEVREFNEFVNNGGDPSKFLQTHYGSDFNYEEADVENNEDAAKRVYRDYLKATTKFSDAKIDKEIKNRIELDELTDEAVEAKKEMIDIQKQNKENLKTQLEEEKKIREDNYKNFLETQKSKIAKTKELAGYEVTEELGKKLYKFGYEINPKTGKTEFDTIREKNPLLELEVLMLVMKGVNKNKVTQEAKSEATKNLRKNLSNFKDKTAKSTTNISPKEGGTGKPNYDNFVIK